IKSLCADPNRLDLVKRACMDAVEKGAIDSGKQAVLSRILENKSRKMKNLIEKRTGDALGAGEDFGKNHPFRRQQMLREKLRKKAIAKEQEEGEKEGKEKKEQKADLGSILAGKNPEVIKSLFTGEGKEALKELIVTGLTGGK